MMQPGPSLPGTRIRPSHVPLRVVTLVPRQPTQTDRGRLRSLDTLRGVAVLGMILVNNPGSSTDVYAPLRHAEWNGCTAADLIFPLFLFIVGTAITLSVGQRAQQAGVRRALRMQILRRVALIFALGLFLNGFPLFDWSNLRIPGVLQRIAICYGLGCLAVLALSTRGQTIATAALLGAYTLIPLLVSSPIQPASIDDASQGLMASVDRWVLEGHLLYPDWDPEGLLSTLGATATTLLGVLAGHWLQSGQRRSRLVAGLLIAGTGAALGGLLLDRWLPINKSVWSAAFVLFAAGVACNGLAVCYWLIDCRSYRAWATPFIMFGTNAIVAYVFSSLVAKIMLLWTITQADGSAISLQPYLFDHVFLRLAGPLNGSLLYAVAYMSLWWGITSVLYRRGVLIKI